MALRDQLELGPREVICLVGGGGKSTFMEALARDYERSHAGVLITTTTKIFPPLANRRGGTQREEEDRAGVQGRPNAQSSTNAEASIGAETSVSVECWPGSRPLVLGESVAALRRALGEGGDGSTTSVSTVGDTWEPSPVVGTAVLSSGKLDGVPVEWVPKLRDLPGVEAVLIEADGAARLPLKAPAPYEPVIPPCATLVIALCGLDAQWAPLDDEHVHRAALLAELLGLPARVSVPPEALLPALILGYQNAVPEHARLVAFFNKADAHPPDQVLVELARCAPVDVWMGAAHPDTGPLFECVRHIPRRPVAVVLAAGLSRRMRGRAKVTLELDGVSLVGLAVRAALDGGAQPPVQVVAGQEYDAIREALERDVPMGRHGCDRWRIIRNHQPERGIGSSLALAAKQARGRDLLVLLADQPFVRGTTVKRLLDAWEQETTAAAAVLEDLAGVWGPPVVINRSLLPQILALTGDEGARTVLEEFDARLVRVPAQGAERHDVDSDKDLGHAERLSRL